LDILGEEVVGLVEKEITEAKYVVTVNQGVEKIQVQGESGFYGLLITPVMVQEVVEVVILENMMIAWQ
jgi:hypothetical protein